MATNSQVNLSKLSKLSKPPFDTPPVKTVTPFRETVTGDRRQIPGPPVKTPEASKAVQGDLIPAEPPTIERDIPANELPDLCFQLESKGYHVASATVTRTGYHVTAYQCTCSLCLELREARRKAREGAKRPFDAIRRAVDDGGKQ